MTYKRLLSDGGSQHNTSRIVQMVTNQFCTYQCMVLWDDLEDNYYKKFINFKAIMIAYSISYIVYMYYLTLDILFISKQRTCKLCSDSHFKWGKTKYSR